MQGSQPCCQASYIVQETGIQSALPSMLAAQHPAPFTLQIQDPRLVLTLCTTCLTSPPRATSALQTSSVCLFASAARDLFMAAGVADAEAGAVHHPLATA
jgi:hypothetical protein